MGIRADRRTKRRVVGRLPTQGWGWEDKRGKKRKKKKKREKEAVCSFLWSELGLRRGGAGAMELFLGFTSGGAPGARGQSLGAGDSAAGKTWEKPRVAQVCWGHTGAQRSHAGAGPQHLPATSCHLQCFC